MDGLRRPPYWLLLPALSAVAAVTAVAWWIPLALLFSAPWVAGIVWLSRRGGSLIADAGTESAADAARRRLWPT